MHVLGTTFPSETNSDLLPRPSFYRTALAFPVPVGNSNLASHICSSVLFCNAPLSLSLASLHLFQCFETCLACSMDSP